jgi:hypothetical protein
VVEDGGGGLAGVDVEEGEGVELVGHVGAKVTDPILGNKIRRNSPNW